MGLSPPAKAFDIGTYSDGYRMGVITKWSMRGSLVLKTGEGEMQLGNEASPPAVFTDKDGKPILDSDGKPKQRNPWLFSSDADTYHKFCQNAACSNLLGIPVVIHYRQVLVQMNNWGGDTDYRVVDIVPTDPSLKPAGCGTQDVGSVVSRSDGGRFGQIVKASRKGNLAKSWEATLLVGNQFKDVSITSEDIYACALTFMRAGAKMVAVYDESYLRNPLARDTNYDLQGIVPAGR
jgi:hypothetical protein